MLQEYGMESLDEDNDDASADEAEDTTDISENELQSLQQQVDDEVRFSEEKPLATEDRKNRAVNFNIANYINSLPQSMDKTDFDDYEDDLFQDAIDDHDVELPIPAPRDTNAESPSTSNTTMECTRNASDDVRSSIESEDDKFDEKFDLKTREGRFKAVEKLLSDARSQRSYSTTASTIAPSVIKDRVKKTVDNKDTKDARKRCVAKGEASAVTRVRNENKDICKQYAGWDF